MAALTPMSAPERTKPDWPPTASPKRSKTASEREHHLGRLRGGIELADDADGAAGAARADEAPLEDDDALHAEAGQLEGERAAGDAAAHDDGVRRPHGVPRSRTGSPCLMAPVLSTRA